MSGNRLLFSAAADYLAAATGELRALFPDGHFTTLGEDLGAISAEGLAIADLARACHDETVVFVRHLMREVGAMPATEAENIEAVVAAAMTAWSALPVQPRISLQVWSASDAHAPFRTDELWRALADGLGEHGIEVARAGREQIAGVVLAPGEIVFGLNSLDSALSDWPGGRVRLAKPKGQISRSEFKLEELFREHDPGLEAGGIAIDLGASPGGWTRILRQRGFTVWAVDPGRLDPRLDGDPLVHHVATTAGPFLTTTDVMADLIVNDMRMEPGLSAALMTQAADRLVPGGTMIQTLKVTPDRPRRAVEHALDILRRAYAITLVRQLHHNRHEVTVVGRKPR